MSGELGTHTETESEDGGVALDKYESDEIDMDTESEQTSLSRSSDGQPFSNADAPASEGSSSLALTGVHQIDIVSVGGPSQELSMIGPSLAHVLENLPWPSELNFGNGNNFADPPSDPDGMIAASPTSSHTAQHGVPLAGDVEHLVESADDHAAHTLLYAAISNASLPLDSGPVGADEDSLAEVNLTDIFGIEAYSDVDADPAFPIDHVSPNLLLGITDGNLANIYQNFEANSHNFCCTSFFENWKEKCTNEEPGYPPISQLAYNLTKTQRPHKITPVTLKSQNCDLQGFYWDRFQTTKANAREVRRMTYTNWRNCGPSQGNFGTQSYMVKFPGAIIPSSDLYFQFFETNTRKEPYFPHYQLRHNLSASSKNALFYNLRPTPTAYETPQDTWENHRSKIMCLNPETDTDQCVIDLTQDYSRDAPKLRRVTTLTAGHGVLVVGGFEGVYAIKSLSADFESGPITGEIAQSPDGSTNRIHTFLDRNTGLPQAVFDSNDKTIKILDCATNKFVRIHEYDYQVNCSATSPDGRLRLLNGDGCQPIVADAETGKTLARLPGHSDFGFACDWAPDGITMATGHQDGLVQVWDARRLSRSIHALAMEQGGCRALHFSPAGSGKRVLVLAEPADFVHIVDAQSFGSKQTIDFFGEISGVTMPPDGSRLYIANSDKEFGGIMEFERSWKSKGYSKRRQRRSHEVALDSDLGRLASSILDREFGKFTIRDEEVTPEVVQRTRRRAGRKQGFKVGTRSKEVQWLDWLPESDLDAEPKVMTTRSQRIRRGGNVSPIP